MRSSAVITPWKRVGYGTRGHKEAFTLIEILCVILIIAVLAAMLIGAGAYAKTMAFRKRAQAQVQTIEGAIVEYKIRYGGIPASIESNRVTFPAGFTYSNKIPVDPWEQQYQYINAGVSYRLFSKGPDRLTGTISGTNYCADDIELKR